jgi:hypothetical protein
MKGTVSALTVVLAALPLVLPTASSGFEYQGFRSGMSLAAASEAATARGWKVEPVDGLPNVSAIIGTTISLSFCDGRLVSLVEQHSGDIQTFAARYGELMHAYGPASDSQVMPLMPNARMLNIDATFTLPDGEKRILTFYSYHGKAGVALNYASALECND